MTIHRISDSETKLIEGIAEGDYLAFELLWAKWYGLAWSIAYRIVGRLDETPDVVQEIAAELVKSASRFGHDRTRNKPRAWFCIIAGRTASAWRNRHSRAVRRERQTENPDAALTATSERIDKAAILAVRQCIMGLPLRQRQCVLLKYYEGLLEREIAVRLGIAEGAVKSHLARARKNLEAKLKRFDT